MRHAISILLTLSLLATMSAGGLTALAQQSHTGQQPETLQDPVAPGQGYQHKLPASARIGSTPERKAAWDILTPAEKDEARRQLNEIITKVKQKAGQPPAQNDEAAPVTLAFTDKDGKRLLRGAAQSKQAPAQPQVHHADGPA